MRSNARSAITGRPWVWRRLYRAAPAVRRADAPSASWLSEGELDYTRLATSISSLCHLPIPALLRLLACAWRVANIRRRRRRRSLALLGRRRRRRRRHGGLLGLASRRELLSRLAHRCCLCCCWRARILSGCRRGVALPRLALLLARIQRRGSGCLPSGRLQNDCVCRASLLLASSLRHCSWLGCGAPSAAAVGRQVRVSCRPQRLGSGLSCGCLLTAQRRSRLHSCGLLVLSSRLQGSTAGGRLPSLWLPRCRRRLQLLSRRVRLRFCTAHWLELRQPWSPLRQRLQQGCLGLRAGMAAAACRGPAAVAAGRTARLAGWHWARQGEHARLA